MTKHYRHLLMVVGAALAAHGCGQEQPPLPQAAETPDEIIEDIDHLARAEAAIASAWRPADDRSDDSMRQPASVLALTGIEPGMTVFEIEAGGGYYTELFSALVGPEGSVIMQSPEDFDSFLAEPIMERLADNRLPNVRLSKTKFDNLDAGDGSVDIATWILGPHELYFTPNGSDGLGDVDTAYAEIFRILKPGGALVILDHAAEPGSPESTGASLHRIDPAIVKALAAKHGFVLVEESDVLHHPEDDYTMSVFDPAVRRMTDRFLLKYVKPE